MPHTETEKHEKDILEIIEKENLFHIVDIFAFYKGCSKATFYNHGLDKVDSIKDALSNNRTVKCHLAKQKWLKSDNATLQVAGFKLICTDKERQNLTQSHIEQKTTQKSYNIEISKEEIKEISDQLENEC